jgi:hypothetical protein
LSLALALYAVTFGVNVSTSRVKPRAIFLERFWTARVRQRNFLMLDRPQSIELIAKFRLRQSAYSVITHLGTKPKGPRFFAIR